MYKIDKSREPKKIRMFLYKPDQKTELGEIIHATFSPHNIKFASVNDLSFTIPYDVPIRNKLVRNHMVDLIREKFLIKVVSGEDEEFYIIKVKRKAMNDTDSLFIQAFSLQYQLKQYKLIDFELQSANLLEVMTKVLQSTGWKVGYINPDFLSEWRSFETTSSTKLDFIDEISKTFNAIVQYDTLNKTVSYYKEEELSLDKDFSLEYGRYLESIEDEIDTDQIITRLHVAHNGKASINAANPTGQSYIDDFSYYLYPFERDQYRNVIQHSYYMSDELCHAILDYNALINTYENTFSSLLTTKKNLQVSKTTFLNELQILKDDLQLTLDSIETYKSQSQSFSELIAVRDQKEIAVQTKEAEIKSFELVIDEVQNAIKALNEKLKFENNFTGEILEEIEKFIQEEEWNDNNQINDEEYYYKATEYLKTVSIPPVNIKLGIVNFFEMIGEQHNWDRLGIGDIVTIYHEKLGIDVKAKVTEISFNYNDGTIGITVSNGKKHEDIKQRFSRALYNINKFNQDYSKIRPKIIAASTNFNARNDRFSENPTVPNPPSLSHKTNDDGSVSLTVTWKYPDSEKTGKNSDNIDGFLLYLSSSTSSERHVFGSSLEEKNPTEVNASLRSFTYTSLVANRYYTVGIQAYRRVDEDINKNGIILSDVITSGAPYQPEKSVQINGDVYGKLNGSLMLFSPTEPDIEVLESQNVVWFDTVEKATKVKTYEDQEFKPMKAGDATTIGGYKPESGLSPNTIPVRNQNGVIMGSITGDAASVGGKSADDLLTKRDVGQSNGVAPLDSSGNIPLVNLGNITNPTPSFMSGVYVGDGLPSRIINTPFPPSLVKVYSTDQNDYSVYIPSLSGGYIIKNSSLGVYIEGSGSDASPVYGKLTNNGFRTGDGNEPVINKLNVRYHWEAVK